MNLREISELVQVTTHLKDVINSAGYTKFKPETITSLKKRMVDFDELFISEMLNYETKSDAKTIHNAVQEARQKMGLDQRYPGPGANTAIEKLQELARPVAVEEVLKEGKKPFVRRNAKPVSAEKVEDLRTYKAIEEIQDTKSPSVEPEMVVKKEEVKELPKAVAAPSSNQPYMEDQSLAALLAAERQKVAAKKRK